ncbi:MAG TPA: hypothetical protein VLT88_13775, partial [Desulfosarcina sp.]|nr:hypothetical protein [Desulfosarcina sp.]
HQKMELDVDYYLDFLRYVRQAYSGGHWTALPREVDRFHPSWTPDGPGTAASDPSPALAGGRRNHLETVSTTAAQATTEAT